MPQFALFRQALFARLLVVNAPAFPEETEDYELRPRLDHLDQGNGHFTEIPDASLGT